MSARDPSHTACRTPLGAHSKRCRSVERRRRLRERGNRQNPAVTADSHARSERVQRNEETFANANEQIRERAERLEFDEAVPFLCECSNVNCMETMQLPLPTYRDARG